MSHLNWCESSPLRKSHVDVHASRAMLMLLMSSGESLFSNLEDLLLYTPTFISPNIRPKIKPRSNTCPK